MFSIVDLRRYRGLITVMAPVSLVIGAINMLLLTATGPSPAWLVPAQTPGPWKQKEIAESQMKGLAQEVHSASGDHVPFLLYMGMSTAREGIEPKLLATPDIYSNHVIGLCGSGGGMDNLRSLADPLIRNDVRPKLTLLCIHSAWLVGRPAEIPPASLSLLEPLLDLDLNELRCRLLWLGWISKNRTSLNHAIRTLLFRTRLLLGLIPIPAQHDPWESPRLAGYPRHATPEFLRQQLVTFQSYGWFDTKCYTLYQQSQAEALISLIKELRKLGSDVVIIQMPEQANFRDKLPAAASVFLKQKLEADFAGSVPPMWNLSDAIPDELFSDYCHVNHIGRSRFSTILADLIRNYRTETPWLSQQIKM